MPWAWVCVLCLFWALGAQAQSVGVLSSAMPADAQAWSEQLALERQALANQRAAIMQAEEAQQALCWQKFAVNACLMAARRARRQNLEPVRQQELALNAQERRWRTAQRAQRLQDKQAGLERTP